MNLPLDDANTLLLKYADWVEDTFRGYALPGVLWSDVARSLRRPRTAEAARNTIAELLGGLNCDEVEFLPTDLQIPAKPYEEWSATERLWMNALASATLRKVEWENRNPDDGEARKLRAFSGWGGISSSAIGSLPLDPGAFDADLLAGIRDYRDLAAGRVKVPTTRVFAEADNQYFTPMPSVHAAWTLAQEVFTSLGWMPGTALEPSAGSGRFIEGAPAEFRRISWALAERDPFPGRILKALYDAPESNRYVYAPSMFEKLAAEAARKGQHYDLIVANPPYPERPDRERVDDPYYASWANAHTYFTARLVSLLEPGGVLVLLTPISQIGNPPDEDGQFRERESKSEVTRLRRMLADELHLYAAVALPYDLFPGAALNLALHVWVKPPVGYAGEINEPERAKAIKDGTIFAMYPESVAGKWEVGGRHHTNLVNRTWETNTSPEHLIGGVPRFPLPAEWITLALEGRRDSLQAPLSKLNLPLVWDRAAKAATEAAGKRRTVTLDVSVVLGEGVIPWGRALDARVADYIDATTHDPTRAFMLRRELALDVQEYLALAGNPHVRPMEEREMLPSLCYVIDAEGTPLPILFDGPDTPQEGHQIEAALALAESHVGEVIAYYSRRYGSCTETDLARHRYLDVNALDFVVNDPEFSVEVTASGMTFYRLEDYLTGDLDARLATLAYTLDDPSADVAESVRAKLTTQREAVTAIYAKVPSELVNVSLRSGFTTTEMLTAFARSYIYPHDPKKPGTLVYPMLSDANFKIVRLENGSIWYEPGPEGEPFGSYFEDMRGGAGSLGAYRTKSDVAADVTRSRALLEDLLAYLNGLSTIPRLARPKADTPLTRNVYSLRTEVERLHSKKEKGGSKEKGEEGAEEASLSSMNPDQRRAKDAALEDAYGAWMRLADNAEYLNAYVEAYNHGTRSIRPRRYSDEPVELARQDPTKSLRPYQNSGVRRLADQESGLLTFDVGLGKAQPLDAKVATPNGWRLMGDLRVGDLIFAADGTAVPITGVYPQGEREVFEVTFSDGAKTRCCDEHLWWTNTESDRKIERYNRRLGRETTVRGSVKDLAEIRDSLLYQTQKNHQIPMVTPLACVEKPFVLPPYTLGVMLGDGGTSGTGTVFTSEDPAIADYVRSDLAPVFGDQIAVVAHTCTGRAQTYSLTRTDRAQINPVRAALRELDLVGKLAHEKFIPEGYLWGSIEQRTALLRGLMDTDGYVSRDGVTVQFTSTSQRLAGGVVTLVQSLGGCAWISVKTPSYTYKGRKHLGREAFTVSLRLPPTLNPFRLQRKAARVLPKTKYLPVRYFTSVQSVGVLPTQCIAVDHPTHLYVTDDFIVTHNTFSALATVALLRQETKIRRPLVVVPNPVGPNWVNEVRSLLPGYRVVLIGFARNSAGVWKAVSPAARVRQWGAFSQGQYDVAICPESLFKRDVGVQDKTAEAIFGELLFERRGKSADDLACAIAEKAAKRVERVVKEHEEKLRNATTGDERRGILERMPLLRAQAERALDAVKKCREKSVKGEVKSIDALDTFREEKSYRLKVKVEPWRSDTPIEDLVELAEELGLPVMGDETHDQLTTLLEAEVGRGTQTEVVVNPLVFWEDLGVDFLVVDEAHNYKNLFFIPGGKVDGGDVDLLGSGTRSFKAFDLYLKTQVLLRSVAPGADRMRNRGVVLLTATPEKNSPFETYNLLSYLSTDVWTRIGITSPETFIKTFVQIEVRPTLTSDGSLVDKQVVTEFNEQNRPDFLRVLKLYEERRTQADLKAWYIAAGREEEYYRVFPDKTVHRPQLSPDDVQADALRKIRKLLTVSFPVNPETGCPLTEDEQRKQREALQVAADAGDPDALLVVSDPYHLAQNRLMLLDLMNKLAMDPILLAEDVPDVRLSLANAAIKVITQVLMLVELGASPAPLREPLGVAVYAGLEVLCALGANTEDLTAWAGQYIEALKVNTAPPTLLPRYDLVGVADKDVKLLTAVNPAEPKPGKGKGKRKRPVMVLRMTHPGSVIEEALFGGLNIETAPGGYLFSSLLVALEGSVVEPLQGLFEGQTKAEDEEEDEGASVGLVKGEDANVVDVLSAFVNKEGLAVPEFPDSANPWLLERTAALKGVMRANGWAPAEREVDAHTSGNPARMLTDMFLDRYRLAPLLRDKSGDFKDVPGRVIVNALRALIRVLKGLNYQTSSYLVLHYLEAPRFPEVYRRRNQWPVKFEAAAQNILATLKRGKKWDPSAESRCGHVLFLDNLKSLRRLVECIHVRTGIPKNKIAILDSDKSPMQRQALALEFTGVKEARDTEGVITQAEVEPKLLVVCGTTGAMGEGLNLQRFTCTLHHLNFTWEPASLHQRDGRAVRQGNELGEVDVYYYMVSGSFDGMQLNKVYGKKAWQDSMRDEEASGVSFGADSPSREELVLELMLADNPELLAKAKACLKVTLEGALTARAYRIIGDKLKAASVSWELARTSPPGSITAARYRDSALLAERQLRVIEQFDLSFALDAIQQVPVIFEPVTGFMLPQGVVFTVTAEPLDVQNLSLTQIASLRRAALALRTPEAEVSPALAGKVNFRGVFVESYALDYDPDDVDEDDEERGVRPMVRLTYVSPKWESLLTYTGGPVVRYRARGAITAATPSYMAINAMSMLLRVAGVNPGNKTPQSLQVVVGEPWPAAEDYTLYVRSRFTRYQEQPILEGAESTWLGRKSVTRNAPIMFPDEDVQREVGPDGFARLLTEVVATITRDAKPSYRGGRTYSWPANMVYVDRSARDELTYVGWVLTLRNAPPPPKGADPVDPICLWWPTEEAVLPRVYEGYRTVPVDPSRASGCFNTSDLESERLRCVEGLAHLGETYRLPWGWDHAVEGHAYRSHLYGYIENDLIRILVFDAVTSTWVPRPLTLDELRVWEVMATQEFRVPSATDYPSWAKAIPTVRMVLFTLSAWGYAVNVKTTATALGTVITRRTRETKETP